MDRFLVDYSVDGSGPLTRSIDDASTSGFIGPDAAHWSIESFIPMEITVLLDYLTARDKLTPDQQTSLGTLADEVVKVMDERTNSYHTRFSRAYAPLDPDCDTRKPSERGKLWEPGKASAVELIDSGLFVEKSIVGLKANKQEDLKELEAKVMEDASEVVAVCEEILNASSFHRLEQEDIEKCVGVASQWGVPLHVDFKLFERLLVYARGDLIGQRYRRRLRNFYRREVVSVPVYQRMVVIFQLRDDDDTHEVLESSSLHLRMFKNIPKQDVDMLLPGTRVRISGVDRMKIIVPSLGGLLMSLRKIKLILHYILFVAAIALHWTAILLGLVIGYIIKSVLSYSHTKKKYQLNLTRNLYFQKLDTNAGAAYRMIQQSHRQSVVETVLAFYGIMSEDQPISTRRLRRKCERIVREAIDVEIDFQVDRSIDQLVAIGAIDLVDDKWQVNDKWIAKSR